MAVTKNATHRDEALAFVRLAKEHYDRSPGSSLLAARIAVALAPIDKTAAAEWAERALAKVADRDRLSDVLTPEVATLLGLAHALIATS
jgi:hypothetical protein